MARNPKYDVWCTSCGCQMKLRRGKYGDFWGCTGYPTCKNTMTTKDAALSAVNEDAEYEPLQDRWDQ